MYILPQAWWPSLHLQRYFQNFRLPKNSGYILIFNINLRRRNFCFVLMSNEISCIHPFFSYLWSVIREEFPEISWFNVRKHTTFPDILQIISYILHHLLPYDQSDQFADQLYYYQWVQLIIDQKTNDTRRYQQYTPPFCIKSYEI